MASPSDSVFARVERAAARKLFTLPPRIQVMLSGGRPRVADGRTLHPEMQLLLAARKLRGGRSLRDRDPVVARARMRDEAMHFAGESPPLGAVRDLVVRGATESLRARHYSPATTTGGPVPLLVFFHGGGFVTGDLDTHDEPCRALCHGAGVQVLAVEYRLAPEHPFPAAPEDACAAFRWAREHAAELGADPARVGVGGDSAGGNLAAVTAQQEHRARRPAPAFQLLIYPVTDQATHRPSRTLFAEGLFLEKADIEWFDVAYSGARSELYRDPMYSPLLSPDLSGLPRAAVVTAGFDPLRDEGDAYAAALARAGVPTLHRSEAGLIHGFLNMGGVSPAARDAVQRIAADLRALAFDPR